jgi:single-stranded-DNA-specific exonuclease
MAVGVSLRKGRLEEFRALFGEAIRRVHGDGLIEPCLELAGWLGATDVTESLLDQLEQLHPFGQGNPEPVFGLRGVRLAQPVEVMKEQHFRFVAQDAAGRRLPGVAWKLAHRRPPAGEPLELAVQLKWNHFNGRRTLQLELLDWRRPAGENSA